MGQRCCRPTTRIDPKHITLLTQIYNDTHDAVRQLNYESISSYLAKKGHLKTLCDYLSSHLNLINPSLIICRNRQFSMRTKKPNTQMFSCVITTEICLKIIALCKQIKLKYNSKYLNRQENSNQEAYLQKQMQSSHYRKSSKKQIARQHISTLKNSTKNAVTSRRNETVANDGYFIEEAVSQNMLQIINQVMKQTIWAKNSLNELRGDPRGAPNKIEITQFTILQKIQVILAGMLDIKTSFVKIDDSAVKQMLDSLIIILLMCRKQTIEFSASPMKPKNSPLASPTINQANTLKIEQKVEKKKSYDIQQNIGRISKSNSYFQPDQIGVFKFNEQQKLKMGKLSLQNYHGLTRKANVHFTNTNLYRDVVKIHMPRLLEYWADLIANQHEDTQKYHELLSSISQNQQGQSEEQYQTSTNKKNKIVQNENIRLIQKIILQFFNSCFSYKQSEYIYSQLLTIFDRLYFNKGRIASIQQLIFQSLRKYQLRDSVISKWFDHLLDYLGIVMNSRKDSSFGANQSIQKQQQNESSNGLVGDGHYFGQLEDQFIPFNSKPDYNNWQREQNAAGCIKTIGRWIQSNQVDLQNILNYKRNKLFVVLLASLSRGQPKVNQQIFRLIQYLIINDVRCYGYLIDTVVFFISKLKITDLDFGDEYTWEDYARAWNKQATLRQSMEKSQSLGNKNKLGFTSLRLKTLKSYPDPPIELIPLQKFIDELIYIACFPFLNKVVAMLPVSDPTQSMLYTKESSQSKKNRKNSSITVVETKDNYPQPKYNNQQLSHPRKQETFKISNNSRQIKQQKISQGSPMLKRTNSDYLEEDQTLKLKQGSKYNTNKLYSRGVFQEIVSVLFQGVHIIKPKINDRYLVKLASLFLAANMQTIVVLAGKCTTKKQIYYVVNLVGKINKFLSKVHKQLKIMSTDSQKNEFHMLMGRKRSNEQYNDIDMQKISYNKIDKQQSIQQSGLRQLDFGGQYYEISSKNFQNFRITKIILNSLHKWLYPSLLHVLMQPTKKYKRAEDSPQWSSQNTSQIVEQMIKYNVKNTKLILNICVKLYIKHLILLSKENLQKLLKKHHNQNQILLDQSLDRSSMPANSPHLLKRHQSLTIKPSVMNRIKTFTHNNQSVLIPQKQFLFFPLNELFEIFLNFRQKEKIRQKYLLQEGPMKKKFRTSRQNTQSNQFQLKRRNTISEINYNEVENKKKKIIDKIMQKRHKKNNDQLYEQLEERINKVAVFLRDYQNNGRILIRAENFQSALDQNNNKLINQTYQIILHQQFPQIMLKIVDRVSQYSFEFEQTTNTYKASKLDEKLHMEKTQKIIDNYLLKVDDDHATVDEPVQNGRCFVFKKAKNKILNIFNGSNPENMQTSPSIEPIMPPRLINQKSVSEKVIDHCLQFSQLNKDNAYEAIPQMMSQLQEQYVSSRALKSSLVPLSLNRKTHFSLAQNDYSRKESVIDSSLMKHTSESGSFAQVFSQIKKH